MFAKIFRLLSILYNFTSLSLGFRYFKAISAYGRCMLIINYLQEFVMTFPKICVLHRPVSSGIRLSEAAYRLLYRDGTFFGIRISITTTYLRRGKRAFFPVFSRENRRIRVDIIPTGCYRNLPGKVRNPDVRRTSETLRFRCSGPIWQRVWISAGGRGRSGDTGTDGRLALPGNRGLPAKKRKLSFEAGLHDSEWSNVCSMETVERTTMESNASSAIRVLFPDRDERGRIGARTIRFRIHYAPKIKNLTYH